MFWKDESSRLKTSETNMAGNIIFDTTTNLPLGVKWQDTTDTPIKFMEWDYPSPPVYDGSSFQNTKIWEDPMATLLHHHVTEKQFERLLFILGLDPVERGFCLATVYEDEKDIWGVYADWLEEHGKVEQSKKAREKSL